MEKAMRKTIGLLASLAFLGGLATTHSASAQGGCGGVTFTGPVLSQLPEAASACREIVTRNGQQFAHFKAEIMGTSGSQIRARFAMPNGQYSKTFQFTAPQGSRVNIAGRNYRFNDLSQGQELDVYLPPDRWELEVPSTENFAAAPAADVVRITTITVASASTLPKTASSVPLVGLLSVVLLTLGTGLALVRRRLS
jgi:hypothetical protein